MPYDKTTLVVKMDIKTISAHKYSVNYVAAVVKEAGRVCGDINARAKH